MRSFLIDKVKLTADLPDGLIDRHFLPFEKSAAEIKAEEIRGTIAVRLSDSGIFANGGGDEPVIYETDFAEVRIFGDGFFCFFKDNGGWSGLSVRNNEVLCVPDGNMLPGPEAAATLFDRIKGGIFLLLRQFGYYILHSSSVIVNGKVIAFTAESGVGKTTHTGFWEKLYNTPVFNGDMLMIDARADIPEAIGIPWSGSTGITTVGKLPLAGIFFLERAQKNEVVGVTDLQRAIMLTQRMLSVNYSHRAFIENAEILNGAVEKIKCARLLCRPDDEAAVVSRKYAENNNWI